MDNQHELVYKLLNRLHETGVLKNLVLVGSWCMSLYNNYFRDGRSLPQLRTRDIDFLILPQISRTIPTLDLPLLLESLGFIVDFRGENGYMVFLHTELMIDFLVPDIGKGIDKPVKIPQLSINTQPLRFIQICAENKIQLFFEDIPIYVPHPAAFALQKLLSAPRRKEAHKKARDIDQAINIIEVLLIFDNGKELLNPNFPILLRNSGGTLLPRVRLLINPKIQII